MNIISHEEEFFFMKNTLCGKYLYCKLYSILFQCEYYRLYVSSS